MPHFATAKKNPITFEQECKYYIQLHTLNAALEHSYTSWIAQEYTNINTGFV